MAWSRSDGREPYSTAQSPPTPWPRRGPEALTSTTSFSLSPLMSSLSFCSFSLHSALCTSRLRSRSGPGECRFASSSSALSSFRLLEAAATRGEGFPAGASGGYSTLSTHTHTHPALHTDLSFLSSSWLIRTSCPDASCVFLVKASSSPSSLFFSFNTESAFFSMVLHLFSKARGRRGYKGEEKLLSPLLTSSFAFPSSQS